MTVTIRDDSKEPTNQWSDSIPIGTTFVGSIVNTKPFVKSIFIKTDGFIVDLTTGKRYIHVDIHAYREVDLTIIVKNPMSTNEDK